MQNFVVSLQSEVFKSFRCQKAANSLDIDMEKKSLHQLNVQADLSAPYGIGLILGASGSGKTTLARSIWGTFWERSVLRGELPVIEQFPKEWSYDQCAEALSGIGLTSVPCWIRPAYTLSNGQRARAEAALLLAQFSQTAGDPIIIDEWTSVVDRTVAKVMSHCIQKWARRSETPVVLLSCHYDVVDWLNPDWVIDCNKQTYEERRGMVGAHQRTDRLRFDVRECGRQSWPYFSKYHYLSDKLPGGKIYTYGLFEGVNQVGFQCFAAYIIGNHNTFFSNRTVIHPDYAGLGLGIKLINESSRDMVGKGYRVKAKFSSLPIYKSMMKQPEWRCTDIKKEIKSLRVGRGMDQGRSDSMRSKTVTYHFDFVGSSVSPGIGTNAGDQTRISE